MLEHPAYSTVLGACHHADALSLLRALPAESVDLVLTSPPYALRRKKAYGNVLPGRAYLEWFLPFATEIFRVLKPTGSFVFEIAPPWERGTGTRALFLYELILKLCETFHLCQELYWHNPAKLPSPAEYVTIRRTRVKDSVNVVWWLGKTPTPKADNRRVLRPYGASMKRLFREGVRTATRPSRHVVRESFERDNGGAIPPNMLEIANTASIDPYLASCREAGLEPHPARFPPALPEFVIRFLTEEGDLVADPFAGSNTTGAVAERLGRRWIAGESEERYVLGSRLRFPEAE
ncbi:MAG: site-specific DNA-methyltransferase [Gemmataceae bacterium]|nr:site-specific DNA-methyltransferase [Gemmataceae bacterium]